MICLMACGVLEFSFRGQVVALGEANRTFDYRMVIGKPI